MFWKTLKFDIFT